ncbi:UNVERIFIED_CONTAM: Transposon Tf2-11 polyprotein [Sesamum indicum]
MPSRLRQFEKAIVTDPVLDLSNMSKLFVVETDASDFALRGVLMQDGHPVSFESMKLKDVERRYLVHEKELLAVVHCLRLWQHYLLGSHFVVRTDNTAYRAGSNNHSADALNRRADLASLGSVAVLSSSAVATSVTNQARELLSKDPTAQGLIQLVEQGKARQFWLEDGLLIAKGNRLYVPKGGDLRKSLISKCHDTLWAGHQGEERTYALVQRAYYWPQMRDDVETYVRTCLICQQDKVDHQKKAGVLQPLPIPKRPWESVSMDYISGLSEVGDLGSIIVVVDRLSKYATFIAAPKHVTTEGTAHLFFKHIVKYWGLPKDIVSDRDSRFTAVFWTGLFKILRSKLFMSSSYHPQSNGQTKCFNSMLEEYLRHFVRATAPPSHSRLPQSVRSPLARSFSQEWKQNVDIAKSCLEKAQKRMKKYADQNRRFIEFNAGDLVIVKVPDPRLSKSLRGRDPRLMQKYVGPLSIIKRIGTVAYKVELPSWWKIHNVFHVSQLKKYSADKEDDACNLPSCPQLELTKAKEKVAEAILNHRVTSTAKRNHTEYLVKWRGCSSMENTWERVTNLKAFLPFVKAYHASHAPRTSPCQCPSGVRWCVAIGGSSLRTASHTVPLSLHCGRRHVRPGENMNMGKAIVVHNTFDTLTLFECDTTNTPRGLTDAAPPILTHVECNYLEYKGPEQEGPPTSSYDLVAEFKLQFIGLLETKVQAQNAVHIQASLLPRWKWFVDTASSTNRIWITWDEDFLDVTIVDVGVQYMHYRVIVHSLYETVYIIVAYGANDISTRRELWHGLSLLAVQCVDECWLVGGDFNVVRNLSEVCGESGIFGWPWSSLMSASQIVAFSHFLCKWSGSLGIIPVLMHGAYGSD